MLKPFRHRITFTEDREVMLHHSCSALRIATGSSPLRLLFHGSDDPEMLQHQTRWHRAMRLLGDRLLQMQTRCATKDHQVSSELPPRRLAPCTDTQAISPPRTAPEQPHLRLSHSQSAPAGNFGRNTAHHVVTGWDNRNGSFTGST